MASKIAKFVAEDIAGKMVAKTYDPLKKLHRERGRDLAEKVVADYYGEIELGTFRCLSKKFHTRTSSITVVVRGAKYQIDFDEAIVVASDLGYCNPIYLKLDHPLEKECEAWAHENTRLQEERKKTRTQIIATILQFGTAKKLREGWPEAAALLPSDDKVVNLPMKPVSDIMQTLANAKTPA